MTDPSIIKAHLDVAVEAAKAAGAQALEAQRKHAYHVTTKHTNDFVTDADKANERLIIDLIKRRFPTENFFGEETGENDSTGVGRWVIDPIDGTTNFFRGVPDFVISIAWEIERYHPLVGVVYVPSQDELFWAGEGMGAWCGGRRLQVSSVADHRLSLIVCVPPHRHHDAADHYFAIERRLFDGCSDIRSFGSAALELCYIAAGRLDGYYEEFLGWYDMAAGTAIVREAGGKVDCVGGFSDTRCDVLASNGLIHAWMEEQVGARH